MPYRDLRRLLPPLTKPGISSKQTANGFDEPCFPVQAGTAGVRRHPSAVIHQALSCCPRCCCAAAPRAPPPPVHRPTALLRSGCHHHTRVWESRRPCGTEASLLGCSAARRCRGSGGASPPGVAALCLCTSVWSDKQAGWAEPACPPQHGSAGTARHRDSQPLVRRACRARIEAERWDGSVLSASCCGFGHRAARGFDTSVCVCWARGRGDGVSSPHARSGAGTVGGLQARGA